MMHYVVVGLSHKTAPVEIREKLATQPAQRAGLLARLIEEPDLREAMLMSTCNRVELYLVARHAERGTLSAKAFLSRLGQFPPSNLDPFLYTKGEGEAIGHLFRVTASLDSMVVGEPQIGRQVKEAYTEAVAQGSTGSFLNRLVHRSLNVAKRIRTETAIGQYPVSLSYAAVVLAGRIFGKLREKGVLVVGAGEMGELAARHLREREVGRILIANRSAAKAELLARELEGEAIPLNEIDARLWEFDIVLTSLESAPSFVQKETVERALSQRKGRAMFFIDLGVPRNVDPEVNHLENVYLYNVDDLKGIVEANRGEREREARRAEGIIQEEIARFLMNLKEVDLAPTIRELSKKLDRIRRKELERYFAKYPGLEAGEREGAEAMTTGIVNKILHDPIILMKTEEVRDGQPKYSEILKKLFRLGDE